MNDKIKTIIYMSVFCIFMIIAVIAYTNFSKKSELISENNNKYIEQNNQTDKKEKIKNFELQSETGEKINIYSLIGKPLVINIWTSWCTYCKIEMPYFNELYLKEKDNVNFVMINATGDRDTPQDAKKVVNENNFSFEIYYDLNLEAINKLGIYSYPTTIFVDKEGYIYDVKIGTITKDELINKVEKLKY